MVYPDSATSQANAVVAMERCILDIRTWMLTDTLRLNDDKAIFFQSDLMMIKPFLFNRYLKTERCISLKLPA